MFVGLPSKCVPQHNSHAAKSVSAFDANIRCAPEILGTASLDIICSPQHMFTPTPVARGNRIAALTSMKRDAPEAILVVDDDSGVLRLVAAVLQNAGYKILEATCGREGLKRFSEHRADILLVLSDLSMPAMTGSEMFRHILRVAPGVRVMFMTGTTEPKLPGEYSKNNFILLHKPFTIDGLIGSVEKSLATCTSSQFLFATPGPSEGSRR